MVETIKKDLQVNEFDSNLIYDRNYDII